MATTNRNNKESSFTAHGCDIHHVDIVPFLEQSLRDSGKCTILRRCLRSKNLPCREVKYLLENGISPHQIHHAFLQLSDTRYWNGGDGEPMSSPCEGIVRVSTMTKFLQLLFEWQLDSTRCNHTVEDDKLDMVSMALTLLKILFRVVQSKQPNCSTQHNDNCDDDLWDADISDDGVHPSLIIASFTFGALLRMNAYVKAIPPILSAWLRGLRDIASTVPNLPRDLLSESVKVVLSLLSDGEEQITAYWVSTIQECCKEQAPSEHVSKRLHTMIKILKFVMVQTTTLVDLAFHDRKGNVLTDASSVYAIMARLHGLPLLPSIHPLPITCQSMSEPLVALTEKLKTWLCKLIFDKSLMELGNSTKILIVARDYFLDGLQAKDNRDVWGKVEMIHTILNEYFKTPVTTFGENDVEWLLSLCKELIFRCLPSCHVQGAMVMSQTLQLFTVTTSRSVQLISKTLLMIDLRSQHIRTSPDRGRCLYHRLLTSWLSPISGSIHHPVTREVIITCLCLHILGLHKAFARKCNLSPRSVPMGPATNSREQSFENSFLALLVKLLFDRRSRITLRNGIGDVLTRLLNVQSLAATVERLICIELGRFMSWNECKSSNRKRKRNPKNCAYFAVEDLRIVCRVLSKLQICLSLSRNVQRELSAFVGELRAMKQSGLKRPRGRTPSELMLLLALVEAQLLPNENGTSIMTEEDIVWILALCCDRKTSDAFGFHTNRVAMAASLVQVAAVACRNRSLIFQPNLAARVGEFLAWMTNKDSSRNNTGTTIATSPAALLEFISLLGNLGNIFGSQQNSSFPATLWEAIILSFQTLQRRKEWPLVVVAISSLVRLAETIQSAYITNLKRCILEKNAGYIERRLSGMVWNFSESSDEGLEAAILAKLLKTLIPTGRLPGVFPTSTNYFVAQGSYLLMVPTREGRTGLGIFPPTVASLQDIEAVLGLDDNKVLKLRHVIPSGNGYKFVLET